MIEPAAATDVRSLDEYMDELRSAPAGPIGPVVIVSDSLPERNGVPVSGPGSQFKAQVWVDDLRVPIGTGNPPPELPPG